MDPLKNYKPEETTSGLWLKFKAGDTVKLRVLTKDPVVGLDNFANTRYNFVVWNYTEDKAQILAAGKSILNQLIAIHVDDDFASLQETDIKISATGEKMEREYNVMPLPTSSELTKEQVEEAARIDLEERVNGGIRMSKFNQGERPVAPEGMETEAKSLEMSPGYEKAKAVADKLKHGNIDVDDTFDISDVPF